MPFIVSDVYFVDKLEKEYLSACLMTTEAQIWGDNYCVTRVGHTKWSPL